MKRRPCWWTKTVLFKRFLLFQQIGIDAGRVSETALCSRDRVPLGSTPQRDRSNYLIQSLTIIGRGWAKYRDLSVASRSIICRRWRLRQKLIGDYITTPLSLKTREVQIQRDQWNKRFRTVQVYCLFLALSVIGSCDLYIQTLGWPNFFFPITNLFSLGTIYFYRSR